MTDRRLLYFLNSFQNGGAEIGLLTLLEHELLGNAHCHVLVASTGRRPLFARAARAIGPANVTSASKGDRPNLLSYIRAFVQLLRLLHDFQPRSVVLSLKQANIVGRVALMFFPRVKCITFEHLAGTEPSLLKRFYEALLTMTSWRVDEVWADCQATLDETRHLYFGGTRHRKIVPLYVCDLEEAAAAGPVSRQLPIRLVTAGRLVERKKQECLIESVARLRDAGLSATLDIYGDGAARLKLQALADGLGLADAVHFRGHVDRWATHAQAYDLFIHASPHEGFCIVAAEAMAAGLPSILVKAGGIPEYATNGRNATLLDAPDPAKFASEIAELWHMPGQRSALAIEARRQMRSLFSADAVRLKLAADASTRLGRGPVEGRPS